MFTPCGCSRRSVLRSMVGGSLLLPAILAEMAHADESRKASTPAADTSDPLAPRAPHFAPKAKRVIYMFQNGAPTHVDMFDWKPKLKELHGKPVPQEYLGTKRFSTMTGDPKGKLILAPLEPFAQHGKSGAWVSTLMPHTTVFCLLRFLISLSS